MLMRAIAALSATQIKERNAEPARKRAQPSVDLLVILTFAPTAEPHPVAVVVNVDLFKTAIGGQCAEPSRGTDPANAGLSKTAIHEPIAER